MQQNSYPIGIIDSGIGGFSVTKKIQQFLPYENLIYLGDGANSPYGNFPQEDILTLTRYLVKFMAEHQVKALLVACNTISCLVDHYRDDINCPVLSVIQSGAQSACSQPGKKIAVISTAFTASTGAYPAAIHGLDPSRTVISHGCANLAGLVEHHIGDPAALPRIDADIQNELNPLVYDQRIDSCVLGCTHYPLVIDRIQKSFPNLLLLDPAEQMAKTVSAYLEEHQLANTSTTPGRLDIYTTSAAIEYAQKAEKVGLTPTSVSTYPPLTL